MLIQFGRWHIVSIVVQMGDERVYYTMMESTMMLTKVELEDCGESDHFDDIMIYGIVVVDLHRDTHNKFILCRYHSLILLFKS